MVITIPLAKKETSWVPIGGGEVVGEGSPELRGRLPRAVCRRSKAKPTNIEFDASLDATVSFRIPAKSFHECQTGPAVRTFLLATVIASITVQTVPEDLKMFRG